MKKSFTFALFCTIVLPFSISAQSIHEGVLSDCTSLTGRYVVPDHVTTIADYAFFSSEVTEVEISASVEKIGNSAFQNCPKLERITFQTGSKLQSVGADAFSDCSQLVEIHLPEGLKELGVRTFWLNSSLKNIVLPSTLDTLPKYCFQSCTSLRKVVLPQGLKVISENAFAGCENILSIKFPSTLDSIATKAFYKNLSLINLSIPEGVRAIADSAFMRCENLERVTLPCSLEKVGAKLFRRCPELETIEVKAGSKYLLSKEGVLFSADLKTLYEAPAKLESDNYIVPNETETLYHFAFYECPNVKGITLPSTIQRIGIAALVSNGMESFSFTGNERYWLSEGSLYYRANTSQGTQQVFMAHPSRAKGVAIVSYGTSYVADYALSGCSEITALRLPSTLLGMGKFVLSGSSKLSDLSCYRLDPPLLSEESLAGIELPSIRLHIYPEAMKSYMTAPYWQLILHGEDLAGKEPQAIERAEDPNPILLKQGSDGTLSISNRGETPIEIKIYTLKGERRAILKLSPSSTQKVILPSANLYILCYNTPRGILSERILLKNN